MWIDAGIVVLQALDELFPLIEKTGYSVFPDYRLLEEEASEDACFGCGLEPSFRKGKTTFAGGFIGFNKRNDLISTFLKNALELALIEKT